jgi:hypothetical protein
MKPRAIEAIANHRRAIKREESSREHSQTSNGWENWTKSIKAHERAIRRIQENAKRK